ncbi:MAG: glycerol-3-phosphate 1-O-acyltransferase PlsY [Firmicutes bacterium]|nr:glycerol-3-phosphate 1-O-acyltransferase PlsY [Bacillota bacterium]
MPNTNLFTVTVSCIIGIIAYLIGSINFSILISKAISGKDIRESGSGNAGATNMLRTHGKKMGILTLLLDVLKGIVVVLIARLTVMYMPSLYAGIFQTSAPDIDASFLTYIAGVCVILGHNFPLYFGFKGGKGVATSLGVVLMLDWKIGLTVAVCAVAAIAVSRYVSLGSILGGMAYIIAEISKELATQSYNIIQIVCVVIIGGLLIARHHANIKRLLSGTENKLSFDEKEK